MKVICLVCGLLLIPGSLRATDSPEGYTTQSVQGWTVHVSDQLRSEMPEPVTQAISLLDAQLRLIIERVPARHVVEMKKVPIWFSPPYEGFRPTGEYHPSKDWLVDHGRRAALAKCVEFTNIPHFEQEIKRMPVLVLHEMAHAYHDRVLSFDQPEIIAAYKDAKESGRYESVERDRNRKAQAYAIVNHKEYFAELTEAYFGENDFYPYNKDELADFDPLMFRLLQKLWSAERPE